MASVPDPEAAARPGSAEQAQQAEQAWQAEQQAWQAEQAEHSEQVGQAERFEFREATDAESRALASGLRLRILRLALDESVTNKEIADALGRHPASVLHHVRTLVDTGFLRADPIRRGARGAREIPYRATGKSWYTYTPVGSNSMLEAFLGEIETVPESERDMTRLGLRLTAADMQEFRDRLYALMQEFHDRPRDPAADRWSVFVALHPDTSVPSRTKMS